MKILLQNSGVESSEPEMKTINLEGLQMTATNLQLGPWEEGKEMISFLHLELPDEVFLNNAGNGPFYPPIHLQIKADIVELEIRNYTEVFLMSRPSPEEWDFEFADIAEGLLNSTEYIETIDKHLNDYTYHPHPLHSLTIHPPFGMVRLN